jgi:hypothetical protein
MRRLLPTTLAALALACGGSTTTDTGGGTGTTKRQELVPVSGQVKFHPLELAWRTETSQGPAPTFEQLDIRAENSTDALLRKAPLASQPLAADGKFSFASVDVVNVSIALVGSVLDKRDPALVMESGYGLHRYIPGEARPTSITESVYVLSKAFEAKLALASGRSVEDLEIEGFVFGQVTDKVGAGVAGAKVATVELGAAKVLENKADESAIIVYLNDDLTGAATDGVTHAKGAFLMFPGPSTSEYTALKDGMTFKTHLSGAREKTGISVFLEEK